MKELEKELERRKKFITDRLSEKEPFRDSLKDIVSEHEDELKRLCCAYRSYTNWYWMSAGTSKNNARIKAFELLDSLSSINSNYVIVFPMLYSLRTINEIEIILSSFKEPVIENRAEDENGIYFKIFSGVEAEMPDEIDRIYLSLSKSNYEINLFVFREDSMNIATSLEEDSFIEEYLINTLLGIA